MDHLDEYEIVQNVALASLVLWSFSVKYYSTTEENKGVDIQALMLILPLVFNESIVNSIHRRNYKKGFFVALNDNRSFFVGLQERTQNMSKMTFSAINMCLSSKLLMYEQETCNFIPVRTSVPKYSENESIKRMIAASDRLGYWFATIDFSELCHLLKVRF